MPGHTLYKKKVLVKKGPHQSKKGLFAESVFDQILRMRLLPDIRSTEESSILEKTSSKLIEI